MREHRFGFGAQERIGRSYRGWLPIASFVLLIGAGAAFGAEDQIAIGTASAAPRGVARVPVYLRDVSDTTLGIDQGTGNRIEALVLKITHSPASAVASMTFERAGVGSAVNPKYERSVQGLGTLGYVAGYSETGAHLPLNLNPSLPGDRIGTLVVTLSPQAVVGSTILLSIDASTAALSNDRGTLGETVANGLLALVNGSISVKVATTTTLTSSTNPSFVGQSVTFTATSSSQSAGSLTGDVTFYDGAVTLGTRSLASNHATLTTSELSQGSHAITAEYSGDVTFAASTSTVITQTVNKAPFGAPPGLTATATTPTHVVLTWWPVTNAAKYEVRRSYNNGPYILVGSPNNPTLNDDAVESGRTYLYIVRAVTGAGSASADSDIDAATTIAFTDNPLIPASTNVRSAHLVELRAAINAFRMSAGLPAASFSDPSLSDTIPIRALHIQELREALSPARSALGLPAFAFSDSPLIAGTLIKAAHVEELRGAVK